MAEKEKRGPFYLLTGLVIGILFGLFYGWVISPIHYFDITPVSLHEDFKKDYFLLVGQAYKADNDIGRAYARIREMMNPVDIDKLRGMTEEIETNPETTGNYEDMRRFVNDLESYINGGSVQPYIQPTNIPFTELGTVMSGGTNEDFFVAGQSDGTEWPAQ